MVVKPQQDSDIKHQVEHKTVSIYDLVPHERNYNRHPQEHVEILKGSLRRFSQVDDIVVKVLPGDTYKIIAHEGVSIAVLQLLQAGECPHLEQCNITVVPEHWTEVDVRGYMMASNETARHSTVDETALAKLLQEQVNAGYDLLSLGSGEETLRQMLAALNEEYQGEDEDQKKSGQSEHEAGSLLSLLNVTVAEPVHTVAPGDAWFLGQHVLLCVHVFQDWPVWTEYLTSEKCLFLPFAGPLIPLSKKAEQNTFVMVQPDPYIAGHILDRYVDIYGESSVQLAKQGIPHTEWIESRDQEEEKEENGEESE